MTRRKTQRDKLMCRLTIEQCNELAKLEQEYKRALTPAELARYFGHVNSKGQYLLPENK